MLGSEFKDINKGNEYYVLIYTNTYFTKIDNQLVELKDIPDIICKNVIFNVPSYIRKVFIPDDAEITIENDNIVKSNKLNYEEIEYIWSNVKYYELCKKIVSINGEMLTNIDTLLYTEYQKEEIYKCAVNQNEWAIRNVDIHNKNYYELSKLAVSKNWNTIKLIDYNYRTDELYKIAITNYTPDMYLLQLHNIPLGYVKEQTIENVLLQVYKNGLTLKVVLPELKTYEICKIAVINNGLALQYVSFDMFTEEENIYLCKEAVINTYISLQYCIVMTPEIYNIAFTQSYNARYYLPEQFKNESYVFNSIEYNDTINEQYINKY